MLPTASGLDLNCRGFKLVGFFVGKLIHAVSGVFSIRSNVLDLLQLMALQTKLPRTDTDGYSKTWTYKNPNFLHSLTPVLQ